jgi:uncharacterized protein (AIM24 family)
LPTASRFSCKKIEAVRGDGDCLLSPTTPGGIQILDVGPQQYRLSDGAFLAATEGAQVVAKTQSLGRALFGSTGGFFVGETSGKGQVVASGFGSIFTIDVHPGNDVVVDNGHVVAWDAALRYDISASTSQNAGLMRNLANSATSGEGMVLRFSGRGRVVLCSRNQRGFLAWLTSKLTPR